MTVQSMLTDPAVAGTWAVVSDRSSIRFINKTLWGLMKVNGGFSEFSGAGRIGSDGTVTGRLTIAAASVRTGIAARDKHLRSADFFDVDGFPDIVVEVTGARPIGDHTVDFDATLSIRGTTLPLPLQATVTRLANDTVHVVSHATVDRTRWGVSGNILGMVPATTALVADTTFVKA